VPLKRVMQGLSCRRCARLEDQLECCVAWERQAGCEMTINHREGIIVSAPQAWTSEHSAVRMLAALAIAHPWEFALAVGDASDHEIGAVEPSSVRHEDKRIDLYFSTTDGREVFIEAKIDDFVSVSQIDKYVEQFPAAEAILLVVSSESPDVVELRKYRPEIKVATWQGVLTRLARINPVAKQALDDVSRLADQPGTKARVRQELTSALAHVGGAPGVRAELTATAKRYPCIDLTRPGTWVVGQIESSRDVQKAPTY